jgi:hypothetical protein
MLAIMLHWQQVDGLVNMVNKFVYQGHVCMSLLDIAVQDLEEFLARCVVNRPLSVA